MTWLGRATAAFVPALKQPVGPAQNPKAREQRPWNVLAACAGEAYVAPASTGEVVLGKETVTEQVWSQDAARRPRNLTKFA